MSTPLLVPAQLIWHGDVPLITMSRLDPASLDAAFLADALAQAKVSHFSSLDALDLDDRNLHLAGAIHHMTRCGSTLMRRQFDTLPGVVALSEPFIFQHLLEGPCASPALTRRRIRQLVALWRDALPVGTQMIIKWPNLLGQYAPVIADALPEVPMLFLHRDPVEVLASIAAAPLGGLQYLRPRHLFGADEQCQMPSVALEVWARSIAKGLHDAANSTRLMRLDYADLPDASWCGVASYFGLTLSQSDKETMRNCAGFHSKDSRPFAPDSLIRRQSSGDDVRMLADTIIAPALSRLVECLPALALSERDCA